MTYGLLVLPSSVFNIGKAIPSPQLIVAIRDARRYEKPADRKAAMARVLRLERDFALTIPLVFEPELTAKLLRAGRTIVEVPISYQPRRVDEGKKIRWTDGIDAVYVLLKCRFGVR